MKITVVGSGYVGLVSGACLAEGGNHVICVDNDKKKIDDLNKGMIPIYEPGLAEIIKKNESDGRLKFTTDLKEGVLNSSVIFLGVGTPSADDGSADISAVLDVAGKIAEYMDGYKIVVTKSTVPVGTHKKVAEVMSSRTDHEFDYVSNPEFLKEGSAVEDFMKPDRVVIGTEKDRVRQVMQQLYAPFMRKSSRIIFMDAASAEMSKYAANTMLATRISFMNELSGLCDKFGADIEKVRAGIGSDSRIGSSFLFAGVGFGGSCFPKDVRALKFMGNSVGHPMTITEAVEQVNYCQQDKFAKRVLDHYGEDVKGKTLAVWGLAFKARTDDIREAPSIRCIRQFLDAGMKIVAYDPEAMKAAEKELDGAISTVDHSYDVLEGADGLVIFTDWQEFRTPDFDAIVEKLKTAVIFDGRNLYDPDYVRQQGIEYYSIGRA
jgi:UDPglucose 6-dehydrogenase